MGIVVSALRGQPETLPLHHSGSRRVQEVVPRPQYSIYYNTAIQRRAVPDISHVKAYPLKGGFG